MAASPHVRKAALFDKAASATYLGSILVLNAEGKVTLKAGAESLVDDSFSDRDFSKHTRKAPTWASMRATLMYHHFMATR